MDNPDLFSKTNLVTRIGAMKSLDEYIPKMKWSKTGDSIIDLGCGDGSVTCILKQYLPINYKKFIACDVNENMVTYAREHHGHENITFRVQDVEGDLKDDLKGNFDHVFSFYLFHWIRNQEKGFSNIYDLLVQGGDCLLMFVGYQPIYHAFDVIGRDEKWKSTWIKDVDNFLSPYYNMEEPVKKVNQMFERIGFSKIEVRLRKMQHYFENLGQLKNLVKAVEPYNMPPDVFDEFFRDFVAFGKKIGFIDKTIKDENDMKPLEYHYDLIVVYAQKP